MTRSLFAAVAVAAAFLLNGCITPCGVCISPLDTPCGSCWVDWEGVHILEQDPVVRAEIQPSSRAVSSSVPY